MKPVKFHTLLPLAAILGLSLLGGCYTQLVFVKDEPGYVGDADTNWVSQPVPTGIVDDPGYIYMPPPDPVIFVPDPVYIPVPVNGTPAPHGGGQPQVESPRRDFGYQRTVSSNGNGGQRSESIRNQPAPNPVPAPQPVPVVVKSGTRTNSADRSQK